MQNESQGGNISGRDMQQSPFAPPTLPTPTGGEAAPPPPPPASSSPDTVDTTSGGGTSRSALVAVALIGLLVLAAVGGWLVLDGGDDANSATSGLKRLPTEPEERYSVTFEDDVDAFYELAGTPERIVGRAAVPNGDEVRVLDSDGTELWRREIAWNARYEMIDGDVVLAIPEDDERDAQLMRLDGASGDELWSITVDSYEWSEVYPKSVLLYTSDPTGRSVVGYDPATGDKLGEYPTTSVSQNGPPLTTTDALSVVKNDEWLVVDERLDDITPALSWEAMGKPDAWAYFDGEILAATGQRLIRYSVDGKQLAAADFDVPAEIWWVKGAGDSVWLYTTGDLCGAVRFAGNELESLWQTSQDCDALTGQRVVRYADADPLLFSLPIEGTVTNVVTGERVHVAENASSVPCSNGFAIRNDGELNAYSWPGNEEVISAPLGDRQFAQVIDGGYATLDLSGERATLTVYG